MKIRVINLEAFTEVFGADCFLKNFPEITTTGVPVLLHGDKYYIHKDGRPVDRVHNFNASTCFFAPSEMHMGIELIE